MNVGWICACLCVALVTAVPAPGVARAAEAAEEGSVGVPENLAAQGWTPLLWAVRLGRAAEARELVEAGADVNAANVEGWSPLFMAAEMGNIELFELLFRHCPDASAQSPNGDTPLHYAAAYGLVGTARAAIEKGADVNARRNNGSTPLHQAAWYGRTELATLLLAQGAEIEAGFDNGTALHLAAYGGHLETVRLLLDRGAEVHARDPRLDTPLHYALYEGHQDVADLLISAGADPDAENVEGIKPFIPSDKMPVVFDHTDREAVIGLVGPVEAAFYRSIGKRDMTGFRETISGQWREAMKVGEMNEAFKPLMMLDPPRQYWNNHEFILDHMPYLQENGTLAVNLRYPTSDEHVFVSHVYFPENGEWKMGGYNLNFRPYNEAWERHHVASLDHYRGGHHEKAIEEAHIAFRVATVLDPPEPRLILLAADTLADMHVALMDFDESVRFCLFIIEYLIKAAGKTDLRIAGQLDKLAGAYVMFGHLDKAALCGGWAEDIRAAAGGDQDAARRVEKEMFVERLRVEAPEVPPENPKPAAPVTRGRTALGLADECLNNLRQIDSAKEFWALTHNKPAGAAIEIEAVARNLPAGSPRCPAGGSYAYGSVGQPPTCSVHGSLDAMHAALPAPAESNDITRLRREAGEGNVAAAFDLAFALLNDDDVEEGLQWLRRVAEQGYLAGLPRRAEAGDATARHHLGVLLLLGGFGIPEDLDDEEALLFKTVLELSAAAGLRGDAAEGVHWLRHAAEQGHANAQFEMGRVYLAGLGTPQDRAESANWYRRAAEQGHTEAQFMLGMAHELRNEKDEALRWYRLAAQQGHSRAVRSVALLAPAGAPGASPGMSAPPVAPADSRPDIL